jgi:hypothetical protein
LAARAGGKHHARARRMRRLMAQHAARLVQDRIGDHTGDEMERLIKAAASGEIGITEAAQQALKIVG